MATTSETRSGRRFEQRGVVMKLVMNMVRNLTIRLADANKMNEERWPFLNVYQSLGPDEIERPWHRAPLTWCQAPFFKIT